MSCHQLVVTLVVLQVLEMAERGDPTQVDMLVRDIYGGNCKYILVPLPSCCSLYVG